MNQACPSDLTLELYLRRPKATNCGPHVADCLDCFQRLSRMRQDGQTFEALVYPATLDAVLARTTRRSWSRWLWALTIPVTVAGVVLLAPMVRAPAPPADYEGMKGDFFTVFVHRSTGASMVADGAEVPAAGDLRFEVRPPHGCWISVVSVDETGQVSKLFPARGDSANVTSAEELPGGAALDGLGGPERLFAICSPLQLPFAEIRKAVQSSIRTGKRAVRGAQLLHGLPRTVLQDTLLLEKRP